MPETCFPIRTGLPGRRLSPALALFLVGTALGGITCLAALGALPLLRIAAREYAERTRPDGTPG